jgi:hypothetical protein
LPGATLLHSLQQGLAVLALIVLLWVESTLPGTYWSPYYKVSLSSGAEGS